MAELTKKQEWNKRNYEENKQVFIDRAAAWAKANPEHMREHRRTYNGKNKEYTKQWKLDNAERYAYGQQKSMAKRRDIEFNLTLEEWIEWWGDDFKLRGRGEGKLVMCRLNDEGPYEVGNIYKATGAENTSEYWQREFG